jgi:hypothetical protein
MSRLVVRDMIPNSFLNVNVHHCCTSAHSQLGPQFNFLTAFTSQWEKKKTKKEVIISLLPHITLLFKFSIDR